MFSRTTTLIRSRNRWARAKMAEARRVTSTAPRITTRVMPMSSSPMTWSMEKAMSTPMTHMRGTGSTICTLQTKACWTTFTSLRVRVIMEPVPNPSKSLAEKVRDLSYRALRMSRPIRAESRAHRKHPTRVPPPETRATPSISPPLRRIKSRSPPATPMLIMSATMVGRYSAPATSRAMTNRVSRQSPR